MSRPTPEQYDEAIANLVRGKAQTEHDGHPCAICADNGHQAWECGHNPLVAMRICEGIAKRAHQLHVNQHDLESWARASQNKDAHRDLRIKTDEHREAIHDFLHWCSGSCTWMGELVGPGKVVVP